VFSPEGLVSWILDIDLSALIWSGTNFDSTSGGVIVSADVREDTVPSVFPFFFQPAFPIR